MEKAFDALKTGGTLYLHYGDYLVDNEIDLNGKEFITIVGQGIRSTRIIPNANIAGAILFFNNPGENTGRGYSIKNVSFFGDKTLNSGQGFVAQYAIKAVWAPEFYLENVQFINVSSVASVYFDYVFVVTFKDCIGIGSETTSQGSPPVAAGGDGLYLTGTSTTITMITTRLRSYTNGIQIVGGVDELLVQNCAPESNTVGVLVSGSCQVVTLLNNYWEGNTKSIGINAAVSNFVLIGNYFNDAINIETGLNIGINNLFVEANEFRGGTTPIKDLGADLRNASFLNNCFINCGPPLTLLEKEDVTKRSIEWSGNQTVQGTPSFPTEMTDICLTPLDDWDLTGSATRSLSTTRRYNDQNAYDISGSTAADSLEKELLTTTLNPNLKGTWITVVLPILRTGGAGAPIMRIDDGDGTESSFELYALNSWGLNYAYKEIAATATKLTVRIRPMGVNLSICEPVILQGLHRDHIYSKSTPFTLPIHMRSSGDAIKVWNASVQPIHLLSDGNSYLNALGGNVGIGTTTPAYLLEIAKIAAGAEVTALRLNNGAGSGNEAVRLNFEIGNSAGNGADIIAKRQGIAGVDLIFSTTTDVGVGNVEAMRIDENGNVGIGTTSSGAKLDVSGDLNTKGDITAFKNSDTPSLLLERYNSGPLNSGDSMGSVEWWGATIAGDKGSGNVDMAAEIRAVADGTFGVGSAPSRLGFFTTPVNSTSPVERVGIDSTGNVGIGTTAPAELLDVNGHARIRKSISINGDSVSGNGIMNSGNLVQSGNSTFSGNILASGYTGLGISNLGPYRLKVYNDALFMNYVRVSSSLAALYSADNKHLQVGSRNVGSSVGLQSGDVNDALVVASSGKVGIGTTSPSTKLDVDGPIAVKAYDNNSRPSASGLTAGTMIYNTDDNAPNFSDGTNWRDAMGNTT